MSRTSPEAVDPHGRYLTWVLGAGRSALIKADPQLLDLALSLGIPVLVARAFATQLSDLEIDTSDCFRCDLRGGHTVHVTN